ncbi:MAG TPA: HypC/HybG/HupF family hydrogenase formation chaperone [Candidatus Limnocylindria bacterium]|nr:HypC/HybG/HupF family hydrogenase formation chaperone [Candidatus Limnocylindria bacterium]
MCQILPARVVALDGERVDVELHGGLRASANLLLEAELSVGDHVLVDRGAVVKKVAPEEAAAILAIYAEMSELLDEAAG